jgi:hypothetical protein
MTKTDGNMSVFCSSVCRKILFGHKNVMLIYLLNKFNIILMSNIWVPANSLYGSMCLLKRCQHYH